MTNYKTLYKTIFKRKAVRSYADKKIDCLQDENIDLVRMFNLVPLKPDLKFSIKLLKDSDVKNDRSDYCIGFFCDKSALAYENIGFMGQQLELHLQSLGLGTCWWGMKKPKKAARTDGGLECVITMSVGHLKENDAYRTNIADFKRKPVAEILLSGESDKYTEAARLAPSAVNLQPWQIDKTNNSYNFYLRKASGIIERMIPEMRRVDMGITLAHIFVALRADDKEFVFNFSGADNGSAKFVASVNL